MLLEYTSMTANLMPYNVLICLFHRLVSCLEDQLDYIWLFYFSSLQLGEPLVTRAKSLQSSPTLWDPMEPARLLCPWNSPGKNTEAGCHFLLQGIFPTQGSNARLLYWQVGFFPAEPAGKSLQGWGARLGSFPEEAIGITQLYGTHSYPI